LEERKVAKALLDQRESGPTYGRLVRARIAWYALRLSLLVVGIAVLLRSPENPAPWLLVGLLVGMTVQDYGWIGAIRRTWPCTARWLDWDRVREAAGTPDADRGGE
jgi:hypothetical protein